MFEGSTAKKNRPQIDKVVKKWNLGYMSYTDPHRASENSFTDMTNMELSQDGIARPRPSLIRYGGDALGTIRGIRPYTKFMTGMSKPEQWEISMQNIAGVGKLCIRKDGGAWTLIGGTFDPNAWTTFAQGNFRVYASNGVDKMSYFDIATSTIVEYTSIPPPTGIILTPTGLTGSVVTYRYRVSANNNVGETMASTAITVTVGDYRNAWNPTSQSVSVTWSAVAGAASYNIYVGTSAGNEQYLANTTSLTFKDNNRAAPNPFKIAPEGNSTEGPILRTLISSMGQLYGVGDVEHIYRFWYSGSGDKSGDFSPYNGGGWVDINLGGDSVPTAVKQFRDGKGTSAITILTKGAAGKGELYHQSFETQMLGDTAITYPVIIAANGEAGTYSSMCVVEADNALIYPTGTAVKTTGTKAQMVNILVSRNLTDTIVDDVQRWNLAAMDGAVGLEYENKVYMALPVGADHNNEIWIHDISRGGAWILRWTVRADYMWLYEDSTGKTHFCVLQDNKILEFSRAVATTDDGVPFRTRLASPVQTFDESGLQMAAIQWYRFLFLRPKGKIQINIYGLNEDGDAITGIANETFKPKLIATGFDATGWDTMQWDQMLKAIQSYAKAFQPVPIEVDEVVCQLSYEIITVDAGCDYALNSTKTTGQIIPNLYYGDE
jgi:hypothetical protein